MYIAYHQHDTAVASVTGTALSHAGMLDTYSVVTVGILPLVGKFFPLLEPNWTQLAFTPLRTL